MRLTTATLAAAAASSVFAQRPDDTSICDYYTTALFKGNTAANQYTLLTALVNTVVIGNYRQPNVGVVVPGILAPGKFDGTDVNLAGYFDGSRNTTNRGGKTGTSINFLDGGGAEPLKRNKPANDENSNQYRLMTRLYEFFGALLGCTTQGMPGFAAYAGDPSMFKVHKFMRLGPAENGYFIQQVALAATSFGVAEADIAVIGKALTELFGMRCAPAVEVIPKRGEELQAICVVETCPLAKEGVCGLYEAEYAGEGGQSTAMTMGSTMMETTATGIAPTWTTPTWTTPTETTMTGTSVTSASTGAAAAPGLNVAAAAVGLAALLL